MDNDENDVIDIQQDVSTDDAHKLGVEIEREREE